MFNQPLGPLNDHLGDLYMPGSGLIKGAGNDFGIDCALHFRHFFWAFINQQDDHFAVRVVGPDAGCDVLQHDRLARLGRRYDQAALPHADG